MKTEQEIRNQISHVVDENKHLLNCYPATVEINSPRALMQLTASTQLDVLYWALGEKRPKFKCDDFEKINQ
jgi:hypothetical protein